MDTGYFPFNDNFEPKRLMPVVYIDDHCFVGGFSLFFLSLAVLFNIIMNLCVYIFKVFQFISIIILIPGSIFKKNNNNIFLAEVYS